MQIKDLLNMNNESFKLYGYSSREEINNSYKPYNDLMKRYNNLYFLNYEEVVQFEKDFTEYAKYFRKNNGNLYIPGGMWPEDFEIIANRKKELVIEKDPKAKLYYEHKLFINKEEVNGYNLWDIDGENIMDFEDFKELCIQWETSDITKEEFEKWLDKNLCTTWAKMDRYGEPYGGFWKYAKETYEYENAYNLTREDNVNALKALPYPRCIIINTINMGCSNGNESVQYTNFICEWIKRKKEIVFANEIPSLQKLARLSLKNNIVIPPHLKEK